MMRLNKRASFSLQYTALIVFVAVSILGVTPYIHNGISSSWRAAGNSVGHGRQYVTPPPPIPVEPVDPDDPDNPTVLPWNKWDKEPDPWTTMSGDSDILALVTGGPGALPNAVDLLGLGEWQSGIGGSGPTNPEILIIPGMY